MLRNSTSVSAYREDNTEEQEKAADLAYFTHWYLENPDEMRRVRQQMTTAELRVLVASLFLRHPEEGALLLAIVMPPDCLF